MRSDAGNSTALPQSAKKNVLPKELAHQQNVLPARWRARLARWDSADSIIAQIGVLNNY
jgi:hypothetical protein